MQDQLWEALEHTLGPYAWLRAAVWPDLPENLDEEAGLPYVALNDDWTDQLSLPGVTATAVVERDNDHPTRTLEVWGTGRRHGVDLLVTGPAGEPVLADLTDALLAEMDRLCG